MSEIIIYGNELYHHGIKGQKWGVRRYQNEDGTLTAEGRNRYGYGPAREAYNTAKANYRAQMKTAKDGHRQALRSIDDETLAKEYEIESNYARGDRLTRADEARQRAMYEEQGKKWNDEKERYKGIKKELRSDLKKAKDEYKNSDEYKELRRKRLETAAKVGAAVAATALVAYGAYKVADTINNKKAIDAGMAAVRKGVKDRDLLKMDIEHFNYSQKYYDDDTYRNWDKTHFVKNLNRGNQSFQYKKVLDPKGRQILNESKYTNMTTAWDDFSDAYKETRKGSLKKREKDLNKYLSKHPDLWNMR